MKKLNKLSLSLVVGSLLFTQSYALPSGGKFTHGTSGSISSSNGTMNISGSKTNSVIQWGGGFNIASGETVNFKGSGYNYLNIVYGSKSSHIDGKLEGGSINANRVYLSTSSVSNEDMQRFANGVSDTDAIFGLGLSLSPVIAKLNGNVINLGVIEGKSDVTLIGNEVAHHDENKNVGLFISDNPISFRANLLYFILKSNYSIASGSMNYGIQKGSPVEQFVANNQVVYETNDKITSTDIDANVMNSIFNDLKFNSSVNIEDLSKFYKDGKLLTADDLASINQSMDFITALYGQTQDSNNATFANALKEVLGNSYGNLGKANQAIIKTKEILSQIPKITEQQKNIQKAYDQAVDAYNEAVKKYNAALSGVTGSNASETITALKTVLDKAYNDLKNAEANLESTTASNNSSLKSSNETLASVSIDGYKLTVNGEYLADYKTVNKPNDNNSGSNNGNDGTDSGDINNGNNNVSNNNPNDTIGQQEPDIATALLMQTTDEDPNINEDDKQASIDEASTQLSGNTCIVSDNFKAGNPCSR